MPSSANSLNITMLAPFGMRPKGTASARALPLGQALVERGHRVRLIVPPWDDESAPEDGRTQDMGGVEVVELDRDMPNLPGAGLVGWTTKLLREGLRDNPDVVHVFKPKGYAGLAGYMLRARGQRWVLDTDDWEGKGGWNQQNPYSAPQRLFFDVQERSLPRLAGAVTVASRTLQTQVWGFGVKRRRVYYVPNGVSDARYKPWLAAAGDEARRALVRMKYRLPESGPGHALVLLYTRFVEYPAVWVTEILRALAARVAGVRLLVVGAGFFGEEEQVAAQATALGLRDRLILCGRVPEEDLAALLAQANLALYPMADTLVNRAKSPVKLLEPMLLGLPTVANRVGQVGEVIRHLENGWLAEPGSAAGLVEGALALLADAGTRERLGRAAARRVWDDYNWRTLAPTAERAYRAALR